MDDPLPILGASVILVALAGSFYFSLSEAALVAVSSIAVWRRAAGGDNGALAIERLRTTSDYLTALIIGFNACNLAIATIMTLLLRHADEGQEAVYQELVHLATIAFILIVAEITPKTYGSMFAERIALRVARPVEKFTHLLAPVIAILMAVSRALFRATGTGLEQRAALMTPDEIRAAAELGAENGVVRPEESEMFESVIELTHTAAREIMVPRVDIVALPVTATIDRAVATALDSGYSRIPLYDASIDNIVGVLYVNDLLATWEEGWAGLQLRDLMREPLSIPETIRVDELFRQMGEQSIHLAIVIDEDGGTEGLVAIEDILEELVGEIEDEHDVPEQEIELLSPTEAVVQGKTHLEDINEALDIALPEDEYETVAGLVSALAGRIPTPGDVITCGGVQFIVQVGDEQQVERLHIIATPEGND